MFHLNRFQQYHLFYEPKCDETCVVCNNSSVKKINAEELLNNVKSGDILNISATQLSQPMMSDLLLAKSKNMHTRLWCSHRIDQLSSDQMLDLVDELMIWCPAPEKDAFNHRCGRDFFDEFKRYSKRLTTKATFVFPMHQMNMDELPEFYDLVDECDVHGMIMYCPKAFSREERKYITRFKRVPRMRIMPIKDAPVHIFIGLPNTIGSFYFEWVDWRHAVRMSLKQWPLIKYTV